MVPHPQIQLRIKSIKKKIHCCWYCTRRLEHSTMLVSEQGWSWTKPGGYQGTNILCYMSSGNLAIFGLLYKLCISKMHCFSYYLNIPNPHSHLVCHNKFSTNWQLKVSDGVRWRMKETWIIKWFGSVSTPCTRSLGERLVIVTVFSSV